VVNCHKQAVKVSLTGGNHLGFSIDMSVPVLTVFLQGIVSFFSPCVLPLIPLYIGYLSGGTGVTGEDGRIYYKRSKVMLHTICFVIGISFTFFLLGIGVSALGSFFKTNQLLFARLGGILVFMFGLYQLGFLGNSSFLGKERRLSVSFDKLAMSPFTALLMGFTFSFAWTPCVGPALASVLIMAASASTKTLGFMLIGVYTLGFILPFLAVGFFTTSVLEFFKTHRNVAKNAVKVGGALMVLMGLLMFTGKMNSVTGYLSSVKSPFTRNQQNLQKRQNHQRRKRCQKR
jgi:cytochrome c-type biogenesis protein